MVIELIRQFYGLPRCFRIVGSRGTEEFIRYSNQGLVGVQDELTGLTRVPLFDISVSAQKQSAYSRLSQNEMALQFYSAGFFDPRNAQAALLCMDMMDFDRKEMVMQRIAANAQQYAQSIPLPEMPKPGKAAIKGEQREAYATRSARQRVADSTAPR